MKVGILGGGLTGLVVASKLNCEHDVLEASSRIGGHCMSHIEQGYTFDVGGPHIMYSRDKNLDHIMREVLAGNVVPGLRKNVVWYKGRYVKYPFENGLGDLEPQERAECLIDYYLAYHNYEPYNKGKSTNAPRNFEEWITWRFGNAIATKNMLPYNRKIWNIDLKEMTFDWALDRVPSPPIEDLMKAACGVPTEGAVHQLNFHYPTHGGIEELPKAFATGRELCNYPVEEVEFAEGYWWINALRSYDKIVSTIPVAALIMALPNVPDSIQQDVAELRYNSLTTVMLGVNWGSIPYTAVYVPDPEILFHRLSFPGNFSQWNVPHNRTAIMAEITTNPGDGVHEMSDAELYAAVYAGLERMSLPRDIVFRRIHREKYAYVVPTFGNAERLRRVLDYVESLGITSVGRVAQFEYINMDEAIRRGIQVADDLNATASLKV